MIFQSGDIIKVVNLPERTGMNGWIGCVERFDDATQKYKIEVRSKGVSSTINLKPENIELANAKIFDCIESSLNNGTTSIDSIENCIVSEGVTEISDNIPFSASLLLQRTKRAVLMDGVYIPSRQLLFLEGQCISIDCKNETVQIDDIDFSTKYNQNKYYLLIIHSGHVIFRRCRFSNQRYGIVCELNTTVTDQIDRKLTVIFENCLFEGFTEHAVCFSTGSFATFLFCTFRNNGAGIIVREGGQAEIRSCFFQNHTDSVIQCVDRLSSLQITDCCIDTSSHACGVFITKSKLAVIERCIITNCMALGIMVEDKAVIKILSSKITRCFSGIMIGIGKIRAEVTDSTISNNLSYGIIISDICFGNITLNNNAITMNRMDIVNNSDNCSVSIDGNNFPKNNTLTDSQRSTQIISHGEKYSDQLLSAQRAYKAAGILEHAPRCNLCNVKEPMDKKFLKCGRCEAVVYCSKECQKNDWDKHKTVCKVQGSRIA
jgi:hypothetical protein